MQHHSKYVPISHALIHVASRQPPLYENPNHWNFFKINGKGCNFINHLIYNICNLNSYGEEYIDIDQIQVSDGSSLYITHTCYNPFLGYSPNSIFLPKIKNIIFRLKNEKKNPKK